MPGKANHTNIDDDVDWYIDQHRSKCCHICYEHCVPISAHRTDPVFKEQKQVSPSEQFGPAIQKNAAMKMKATPKLTSAQEIAKKSVTNSFQYVA